MSKKVCVEKLCLKFALNSTKLCLDKNPGEFPGFVLL